MLSEFIFLQGAVAEIFLKSGDLVADARGMASLVKIAKSVSWFYKSRSDRNFWKIYSLMQAGLLPPYVPFAQAFAAVITAALTGSLYYMAASPKGPARKFLRNSSHANISSQHPISTFSFFFPDPTYVVAPVLKSRSGREDLKKLFAGEIKILQPLSFTHQIGFAFVC